MPRTEAERITALEEKVDSLKESIDRVEKKMDDFIKCSDKRYASKTTEVIVYGLVGIILSAVVYMVLDLVGFK
jgi:tetrahydromethanopterin S-methyltransferase subunit B